jgi:hypothetical protein
MATRNAFIAGCLIAAAVITRAARAAAPGPGDWDSRSPFPPVAPRLATVNFEVAGPPLRRVVRRVAAPPWCTPEPPATGYFSAGPASARVRADGRFTIFGGGFVLHGRFVTPTRAEVRVRTDDGDCGGVRRYAVHRIRPRVPVRTGRYLTLAAGGAELFELEVDVFGREVIVEYLRGSVPAACSDGSQRPLSLLGADGVIYAPIGPAGRFEAVGTQPPFVHVSGTFSEGAVAALLTVTEVQPDGVTCRARGVPVVGALAFPF